MILIKEQHDVWEQLAQQQTDLFTSWMLTSFLSVNFERIMARRKSNGRSRFFVHDNRMHDFFGAHSALRPFPCISPQFDSIFVNKRQSKNKWHLKVIFKS